MIIYVESKAFPYKSFVTVVNPGDKVARVRAQMLHILYEIGREEHQFRLRYNGQYLRDAFYLEDYNLESNSVVHMVPLSNKKDDSMSDLRSLTSNMTLNFDPGTEKIPTVKSALYYEVKHMNRREWLLMNMNTLFYIHFLSIFLAIMTSYPYAAAWMLAYVGIGWYLVPGFTRIGGYIGNTFHLRFWFCGIMAFLGSASVAASAYLAATTWMAIINHGCKDWEFVDDCSRTNVYTAIYISVHALVTLITTVMCGVLAFSFRIEVGDVIEKYLVQERDIEEVMKAARSGRQKERRTAAYELATMAASSDDNKFRIVAEGGLDVIMAMYLSNDEPTQEYAVEALSELITIQSIQDTYVEMGGVRSLMTLLHSNDARVMQEASRALYLICQSDENRHAVVEDHGLTELAHAARFGSIETQRMVASIFLELVFNTEIRAQLTTRNIPAQALVYLCSSNDPETLRFALLTLELLAIESSDVVCAQEELLDILLDIPMRMMDKKLSLLAGKILLYLAENPTSRDRMMDSPEIKETLLMFAKTGDPVLQKVVVKIIFCMMDTKELKAKARALKMEQVLKYCLDNAADRDVWDMADQGVTVIRSVEDSFPTLPTLSTLEKLSMGGKDAQFGSRASLRSAGSSGSNSNNRS